MVDAENDPAALRRELEAARRRLTVVETAQAALQQKLAALTEQALPESAERKRTAAALRESESKLRHLFENLPDFVLVVDRQGRIQFANRAVPGATREALIGSEGFAHLIPEHRARAERALEQAFLNGQPQVVGVLDIYGQWWEARVVAIADPAPGVQAMVICADITQRRKAEEAVQRERQLLKQMLEVYEKHRQLTAYEIHDGISQPLSVAQMMLEASLRATGPTACGGNRRGCEAALDLLRDTLNESRRQIITHRPSILDDFGVVVAIDHLVKITRAQRESGPVVQWTHAVAFDRLFPPLETAVYRIVQEALSNAVQHSQSPRVAVRLTEDRGQVVVEVEDWGRGFDPAAIAPQHFGLEGIRQRARLFGGRARIESVAGQGTTIRVEIPLVTAANANAAC